MSTIRLTHTPSGTILAEGPKGFGGITPFEGNFYIRRKYLRTDALKVNRSLSTPMRHLGETIREQSPV